MTTPRIAPDAVWDVGLQPERTVLAWRRFALALAAIGLAMIRVVWFQLGWWSLLPSGVVLAAAGLIAVLAERRYQRWAHSLVASDAIDNGARLTATAALAVTGIGVLVLVLQLVSLFD